MARVSRSRARSKRPASRNKEATAETGGSKTTFSGAGAKPPAAPSASDQAFGPTEQEQADPSKRFREAMTKRDPGAITIAGESPTVIGALLTKDPALAATYFELVAVNRSNAYRDPLRALFPYLNLADKKKLLAAQLGFQIVDPADERSVEQLVEARRIRRGDDLVVASARHRVAIGADGEHQLVAGGHQVDRG